MPTDHPITAAERQLARTGDRPTVMITGAGSGIGHAVTSRLLTDGFQVFGGAISDDEAASLTAAMPGDFHAVVLDVRDESSVAAAGSQVADALDRRPLAALLNIAGVITNGPLLDLTAQQFTNVLAVNLVGTHTVTRAFLPLLRRGAHGRIINMSSSSGSRTMPFAGAYSASKFGVEALSQAMRLEFYPFGVHVSVIAPGLITTPMADTIQTELSRTPSDPSYTEPLRRFLHQMQKTLGNGVPMQRVVDTIVGAITADKPQRRYDIHQNYLRDVVLMRALPALLRDTAVVRTLALTPQERR